MKARIIKKLSKKLVEAAPKLFSGAFIDEEVCDETENQGVRVSHVYCVGGGVDYWGEGEDCYTVLEFFKSEWCWYGDLPLHSEGHEFEGYPNTGNFNPTGKNLLKLARECG